MNRVNPKKLLHSKWTAATPQNKEKHFVVTAVGHCGPDSDVVDVVTMEAVRTQRKTTFNWRDLKHPEKWRQGWI